MHTPTNKGKINASSSNSIKCLDPLQDKVGPDMSFDQKWNVQIFKVLYSIKEWHIAGEVFLDTQPLIRSVLDGFKVCIFAYGQTGSGKTFTMVSL